MMNAEAADCATRMGPRLSEFPPSVPLSIGRGAAHAGPTLAVIQDSGGSQPAAGDGCLSRVSGLLPTARKRSAALD